MIRNRLVMLALIVGSLGVLSCSNNDDSIPDTPEGITKKTLVQEVLDGVGNKVIVEIYKDLYNKSVEMEKTVNVFIKNSTDENLEAIKKAWVNTRIPWEQSEVFLYGPVEFDGIDPAIDTWPVDVEAMNNIIKSNKAITPELISVNAEARGFHLIEFLIWGENGKRKANELSPREKEYLKAAITDVVNNTKNLYMAWAKEGKNYVENITNPKVGGPYPSANSVLEQFVEGMITIADEVGSSKIAEPLNAEQGKPSPEKEESRFSNNSKADFVDNIRGIKSVYLGNYNQQVKGVSDLVLKADPALDKEVREKIDNAIKSIENIPGTFTEAIYNNRADVEKAVESVDELIKILQSKLKPLVSKI